MVYCVGLTGNLGSGKSSVAALFAKHGVELINADQISRQLTEKDQSAYKAIVGHFGTELVLANGDLDRKKLREIVFSKPDQLQWLEGVLHPLIRERIKNQVLECQSAYCVIEIPLLINRALYPYLDRVLLITAPLEQQLSRVQSRDNCSREQALAILATQPSLQERLENADDVISNDGEIEALENTVQQLHSQYLQNSAL